MRITVDIDPKLLDEVVKLTGERTKSKAANKAIEEYLRWKAYDELLALAGTMEFDDDWDVWRRTDLGKLREFDTNDRSTVGSRLD